VAGQYTWQCRVCAKCGAGGERCQFGEWPVQAGRLQYAPSDNPEIIIGAFMYNGGEGAVVAAPVVEK